jgi:uncharacterized protein YdaU (DUF1376 family)
VNYYRHFIGDFQRDTSHLSLTERGAYRALIDHYYATEKPLPVDHSVLCRIAGAMTKAERDAVKTVIPFFHRTESGLVHDRIEAELEKASARANKNREIAVAREARRRADREARTDHDQSTKRARNVQPIVSRTDHDQSTKPIPSIPKANAFGGDERKPEAGKPPDDDPKAALWSAWKALPDGGGGAFLGKLVRDGKAGGWSEQDVLEAVERTLDHAPADPKGFISGVLKKRRSETSALDEILRRAI